MAPAYTTWNFHSGDPKVKKNKIFFSAISSTGISFHQIPDKNLAIAI